MPIHASLMPPGTARHPTHALCLGLLVLGCGGRPNVGDDLPLTALRRIDGLLAIGAQNAIAGPFGDVRGAQGSVDGRIALAEASLHQVVLLDTTGVQVGAIGREGSGPGEFREPQLVAFWGDSLAVFDPPQRRLSYLRMDGSLIRQRTISIQGAIAPMVLGIRSDGAVIFKGSFFEAPPEGSALIPASAMVFAINGADAVDTVATMSDGLWHQLGFRFYAWRSAVAVADSGVWCGEGGSPTLRFAAWDGRSVSAFHWEARTRPVTEADRSAMIAMGAEHRASPEFTANDRFADSIPYFARLLPDPAGGVWVVGFAAPFAAPDSAWRIDERAGTIQGIDLPEGFRPTQIGGDFILGLRSSEEGDLVVVRYRLSR